MLVINKLLCFIVFCASSVVIKSARSPKLTSCINNCQQILRCPCEPLKSANSNAPPRKVAPPEVHVSGLGTRKGVYLQPVPATWKLPFNFAVRHDIDSCFSLISKRRRPGCKVSSTPIVAAWLDHHGLESCPQKSCYTIRKDDIPRGILKFMTMSNALVITSRERWNVKASDIARRTHNPIRSIVENIVVEPNPNKKMIALSIGDPTIFGNLKTPKEVIEAVQESVAAQVYNGYAPSTGYEKSRAAVAKYSSDENVTVDPKDVILCSGCSCALDLCITALAKEGQNILIPRPGFSIYRTLAEGLGITVKSYNLVPELDWQIDLEHLKSQIDEKTAAIIINNPSNPCGSVFSRQHLLDILDVAARFHVPIIADEIYEHLVFPGQTYYSLASLSSEVPILSCSGLTKRFLIPGWRMGWIIIHDRQGILEEEVRKGLICLSQRIIGSNTIVQGALPAILSNTPQKFFDDTVQTLYTHAKLCYSHLVKIPGLKPIMPAGAMYMMVHIDLNSFPDFKTETEFVRRLLMEESVFCLPGECFDFPSYMRLVITIPVDMLDEACQRIQEFCSRHHLKNSREIMRNSLEAVGISY